MTVAEMIATERLVRARGRYRASLVVLVIAAVVAGLLLWRDLRDDRPYAKAGLVSEATQDLPVQWRRSVLVPGARYDVTAAVREDVTDEPGVHRMQAPDGGTFAGLGIVVSDRSAPDVPDADGGGVASTPTRFTVVADGRRYPLSTDDTADSSGGDRGALIRLPLRGWLAVAGSADQLIFEVTWQERTQRVDLRSGDRVAGDFATLYARGGTGDSRPADTSCGTATWTPGWRAGPGVRAACSFRVERLPWSASKGWAKPGRQWLALTTTLTTPTYPIRRVGTRDLGFSTSGYASNSAQADTAADSPDRLDGARPVAVSRGTSGRGRSTAVLVFDIARTSGAHTAVLTQDVYVTARFELSGADDDSRSVSQTWTVRLP